MKAAPKPREVIGGKKFKCDTKEGKKCVPRDINSWMQRGGQCIHCGRFMNKDRGAAS